MSKIAVLCNDGVEEIECLTVVDFCRRAGIEVITAFSDRKTPDHGRTSDRFSCR